jgi:hypothetical protein
VTREQKKRRRALAKEVALQMRSGAVAGGWKYAGGFVFREHGGWFVELTYGTHVDQPVTTVRLYAKPMALDPVFWEIVGLPENNRQPLSFRARGAWTCSSPSLAEFVVDDATLDAEEIAARVLRWGDAEVTTSGHEWTLDSFIDRIERHPRQIEAFSWLPALTSSLVLAGQSDVARQRCHAARDAGASGGFTVGSETFADLALSWIDQTRSLS